MGYPWGKAPLADGTGTTPMDMQRILGAQYVTHGVIPDGGLTVSGTSSMAYKVEPGAVFMWTSKSARLGVLVPVDGTTVSTLPAPSTGSRTDTVYVYSDGSVRVAQGTTIPAGVIIARYTVPAGITSTTSAQQSIDRNFAITAGASLGRLAWYRHPGGVTAPTAESLLHSGRFYLPSDRLLRVDITTTIKSATSAPGVAQFDVDFTTENGSIRSLLANHTPAWNTWGASWNFTAREGALPFQIRSKAYGGGAWEYAKSGRFVTEVTIWDAGVSR